MTTGYLDRAIWARDYTDIVVAMQAVFLFMLAAGGNSINPLRKGLSSLNIPSPYHLTSNANSQFPKLSATSLRFVYHSA